MRLRCCLVFPTKQISFSLQPSKNVFMTVLSGLQSVKIGSSFVGVLKLPFSLYINTTALKEKNQMERIIMLSNHKTINIKILFNIYFIV